MIGLKLKIKLNKKKLVKNKCNEILNIKTSNQ